MTTEQQSYCARCGAVLRRRSGPQGQAWCDPCRRIGPNPRRDLPPGFYFQDPIAAALGNYDFRTVFRRIRMATGWPQQILAELTGLEQARISAIERGVRPLRDVALVARISTRLAIPAILLGFGTTVSTAEADGRKQVSWVDRRDFVEHVAALALSTTAIAGLDIDRLIALLPHTDPSGTRHIGATDIEAIEQTTTAFVRQDYATGGGMVRDAAAAHLHATLPLLNAQTSPELRPWLHLAMARLAMQVGWMSFECKQHDAARRLWLIGLDVARAAEHPLSSDLTVYLLYHMALQAVHLGRPKEALRLVHFGHAAASGLDPVSPSTACRLVHVQAMAHADQNDARACGQALGQGTDHFSDINPATTPAWGAYLDHTRLASWQGDAHYELALASRDPQAARQAVPLLRDAVDHFGPDYARLQATSLTKLAGAHAIAGDLDAAVSVGHQAIDAVAGLHSPRNFDRLRVLDTVLQPLHTSTGVTELRNRLSGTTAESTSGKEGSIV